QGRTGNDRHAVGMVQSEAGFQDVFGTEANDQPAIAFWGSEIGLDRIRRKRPGPAVERDAVDGLNFVAYCRVDRCLQNGLFFLRVAVLATAVIAEIALKDKTRVLGAIRPITP